MQYRNPLQKFCSRSGLLLVFMLAASLTVFTQDLVTKGNINGRVVDPTGAAISGAKVTVTGPTGDRSVAANAEGEFDIPNLSPGTYTVKAEQAGFKTASLPNVAVY